jgi:NAD(P)-dependent dehydrogenase (short-subunit alcohol dehydrogenase family)
VDRLHWPRAVAPEPTLAIAGLGDSLAPSTSKIRDCPKLPDSTTRWFLTITDQEWMHSPESAHRRAHDSRRAAWHDRSRRGAIVAISSVNASLPDPAVIDYGAGKGALTHFCKSLSKEFCPRGIRINTISPGPVSTTLCSATRESHRRSLRPPA